MAWTGKPPRRGQSLSPDQMRETLEAAHQNYGQPLSTGVAVTQTPFGAAFNKSPVSAFGLGHLFVERSFLARVIPPPFPNEWIPGAAGPPPPDFTDERYWIEEVSPLDPLQAVPVTLPNSGRTINVEKRVKNDFDAMDLRPIDWVSPGPVSPPSIPPEVVENTPKRIVVASNIAEWADHTHSLGLPIPTSPEEEQQIRSRGQVVFAMTAQTLNGGMFHFFNSSPPASASDFCVVRGIASEPTPLVVIEEVFADSTGAVTGTGSQVAILPWPNVPVGYYQNLIWPGEITSEAPVIRAVKIDGAYHAEQILRHRLPNFPRDVRYNDCQPPSFSIPNNRQGACCLPEGQGACQVMLMDECLAANGIFQGEGTTCSIIDCCQSVDCTGPFGP